VDLPVAPRGAPEDDKMEGFRLFTDITPKLATRPAGAGTIGADLPFNQ
jgi:hypothetical protein